MTREEHINYIKSIRETLATETPDIALITNTLATLSEDYGTILATTDQASLVAESLKNENQRLKESNMELFLAKVGVTKETTTSIDNKVDKLEFDNLFNEKGELK